MEKRDARLFQMVEDPKDANWNIVELESHRGLRHTTNEIIQLCHSHSVTTAELRQQLQASLILFGRRFSLHMARSLQEHHHNQADRQAIVSLLTLLDDKATVPLLQQIANQQHLPRTVRLSASLALTGMGATQETTEPEKPLHEYALKHSS